MSQTTVPGRLSDSLRHIGNRWAILVKHGRLNNDQQMQDAGADLVRIAEQSAPQGIRLPQRGKQTPG
jgi:hypothetical protein